MALITIGDLNLAKEAGTKQARLYRAIQQKIVQGLWPKAGKLPSTRELAQALNLSRNTVSAAYEQLTAEGYLESRPGSGFYVAVQLPDFFLGHPYPLTKPESPNATHWVSGPATTQNTGDQKPEINRPFAPGVPDLAQFPSSKWQRLIQRHVSRITLLGNQDIQGDIALRQALSHYLASSRSVHCDANRIIITSGAQQALSIALMATLNSSDTLLMEQPGYTQMSKLITLLGYQIQPARVRETVGLDLGSVLESGAKALYITPSNQYPLGTSLNTEQRLQLIDWAVQGKRWIIEDDYDSEFQFAHRPYTSLQGLAGQIGLRADESRNRADHVLYIGSFSKVMFNSLRLGYLVVAPSLVERCLSIKDTLTGDSPAHTQAALADFIHEGDLLRHIRKMRRLYKAKYHAMLAAIQRHFGQEMQPISQPAGLHITLKWHHCIDEATWTERAKRAGIVIRPLSLYEQHPIRIQDQRNWHGAVLGFGNIAIEAIEPNIETLATLFYAK